MVGTWEVGFPLGGRTNNSAWPGFRECGKVGILELEAIRMEVMQVHGNAM